MRPAQNDRSFQIPGQNRSQTGAYHSQGRQGQNVPVDVTPVKQVKKPSGAKPGMVVYYTYRTVIVNPKDKTE